MTNEPTAHEPATGGEQPEQPREAAAEPEPTRIEPVATEAGPGPTRVEPVATEAGPTQPRYTGPPRDDPRLAGGAFPPPAGGYQTPGYQTPGYQTPGYQTPGYQTPQYQPPAADGWASRRYGLVRPSNGRVFAGVCGALGRATNTDPVLWRVLLAVFTLVGGVGLLAYVLGWMLIPAEGDTASPIEALFGRGRSSTSPVLVIVITAIVVIAMGSVLSRGVRSSFVPVIIVILAIILLARRSRPTGPAGTAQPGQPAAAGPPAGPAGPVAFPATTGPAASTNPAEPAPAQSAGYRPPFAPHGPYAMGSKYPYPGLAFAATTEPAPAPAPPARRSSRLGLIFFALALLAVGIMALIDLSGERIPIGAYFAVPLAVIGAGLLIGAWAGRAHALIFPGVLLTLALAASPLHVNVQPGNGDVTWTPASYADLATEYRHGLGDARLDLRHVDFTDRSADVSLHVNAGDVRVSLPPDVDTTVDVTVRAGDATVFDTQMSGVGMRRRTVTDNGADGPGGGRLHLTIRLDLGSLRVER